MSARSFARAGSVGLLLAALFWPGPAGAGDVVTYYHLDAVGNVRAVTDQGKNVIERHDYLPFGEECTTGPCAANLALGPGQPRKFTGKERDPETGLDYFGARYYRANIGRFTTTDPVYTWQENILDPQRWNRYAYARNNPLRYTDPDGRIIWWVAIPMALFYVVNNPTPTNVTTGPSVEPIVPNSAVTAFVFGAYAAYADRYGRPDATPQGDRETGPGGGPSEPYSRAKHYGRTPTKADRGALGAGSEEVVDHEPPLVKRYYEGDPGCCERPGHEMSEAERRTSATDRSRMRLQPRSESNKQGGEMSKYSQEKKKELFDQ